MDSSSQLPLESSSSTSVSSVNSSEPLFVKDLKKKVKRAVLRNEIFTIIGNFADLRRSLNNRGWVEKCSFDEYPRINSLPLSKLILKAEEGNKFELAIISRMLSKVPARFMWNVKNESHSDAQPMKNHIRYSAECNFTTKSGLATCAQTRHWNFIPGVAELTIPRCYVMRDGDERDPFWKNFQQTACVSLAMFVYENQQRCFDINGEIGCDCIDFALLRILDALERKKHLDIDEKLNNKKEITEKRWIKFLKKYEDVVHSGKLFRERHEDESLKHIERVRKVIKKVLTVWPFAKTDGTSNIWIFKPWNTNRGVGIQLLKTASEIKTFLQSEKLKRYVIQKYIERPLLIHKTKFDIRQHFLIKTNVSGQEIWMYKRCYFRFSSQEFKLNHLNPEIHLTNRSVQKNYVNSPTQSPKVPSYNMWTFEQMQDYFESIGQKLLWWHTIYPEMKKNIIAVVLCAQEKFRFEVNAFEIFGCDFILTDHFETILLEVNSYPNLKASTPVTKMFFPNLLEDLVKVVVDLSTNADAPTGDFECIYQLPGQVHADVMKLSIEAKNYFKLQKQIKKEKNQSKKIQKSSLK